MFTVKEKTSVGKQRVSSSVRSNASQQDVLCERLLRQQPQCETLLKRLLARSHRPGRQSAFARIQDGRCSACNMTIACARIQQAKAGEFINCAHCMRFLYDPR